MSAMVRSILNRIGAAPDGGLRGYAEALVLVAVSTLVGMVIAPRWGNSAVDLIYLPTVLAIAVIAGLGPALLAAIGSALAYNFFFTAPYHTFRIHSPSDIVTVVVLFLVAVVTSHLAASIRAQAELARAHAARNATIAGLARRLLTCTSESEIGDVAVMELGEIFDCNAVLLAGEPEPHVVAAQPSPASLTPSDLAAAAVVLATGQSTGRGVTRVTTVEWQLHPVVSGAVTLAVAGLARDNGVPAVTSEQMPLLGSLLDQVALALERARLEREARDFATVRERDRTRSALLASIGHDVRPRLKSIGNHVSLLRRAGTADKELVSAIGSEALKLDRYISDLVELGPASDQQPVESGGVRIDHFHRVVSRNGEEVHLTPKEYAVLAELAKHPGRVLTHAHLLRTAWGPAQQNQTEYLRVAVRGLRQKLEPDPAKPTIITNEPSVGYRLAV
jgi:two-component system sensor histidine kinase KdpD